MIEFDGYALVVVDLQHRVVALATEPHRASDVVRRSRDLAEAFRRAGLPVIFVRTVNLNQPDTEGDELVEELDRQPGDILVTKHQWDAFHGTPLDIYLRHAATTDITLVGLMTNFGVESTARTADAFGYGVVVVEDATASVSAAAHRFAVTEIFPRLGRVVSIAEIVGYASTS
jgi:nicotinamidase-related amidase